MENTTEIEALRADIAAVKQMVGEELGVLSAAKPPADPTFPYVVTNITTDRIRAFYADGGKVTLRPGEVRTAYLSRGVATTLAASGGLRIEPPSDQERPAEAIKAASDLDIPDNLKRTPTKVR